MLAVNIK